MNQSHTHRVGFRSGSFRSTPRRARCPHILSPHGFRIDRLRPTPLSKSVLWPATRSGRARRSTVWPGQQRLAHRREAAVSSLNGPEAVGWTEPISNAFADTAPLVQALALAATRLGNDPRNQKIARPMLEDFAKNRSPRRRGRLLLASAQQTAAHRKYGDPLVCSRRFGGATGIARLQ
jgi:hypothetical protein